MLRKVDPYRLLVFGIFVLLTAVLEIRYRTFVAQDYQYMGFEPVFFRFKFFEAKLVLLAILTFSLVEGNSKAYLLLSTLTFFYFIPNTIYYAYSNLSQLFLYSLLLIVVAIHFIFRIRLKPVSTRISGFSKNIIQLIFLIMLFLLLVNVLRDYGKNISLKALYFNEFIYQLREESSTGNVLSQYTFGFLFKFAVPIMILVFIERKRVLLAFGFFVLEIFGFLMTGNRSVFFTVFVILFFFFGHRTEKKIFNFLASYAALLLFAVGANEILHAATLESILLRRTMFVPARMNECYFEFFKGSPVFLSHSVLSPFIPYPYDLPPANLISSLYFHAPEGSANNGLLADGYMNFGMIGIILYIFAFAGIMRISTSLLKSPIYDGVIFVMTFTFLSSALFTCLLTHGVLLLLLFAALFRDKIQT
ncbi:MAG: hypothetical protein R2751_01380 [Bacteroidales bacterium]